MIKKEHTLWIERYRPKNLEEYIGSDELKDRIGKCLKDNDIPHFLFYGPSGTGKTSIAKILINHLKCDYLYLNASDENGIDTIREKVKSFASTASFQPIKIIILDEADRLTAQAQDALRNTIEEYTLNTRFILTANNFQKITAALKSRCENIKVSAPSKGDMAERITNILDAENVKYEIENLVPIINSYYPDMRSMLKVLQSAVGTDNVLNFKEVEPKYFSKILEKLKKPTKTTWYEIRQIIANYHEDDYTPFYQFLFSNLSEFGKGNEAQLTIVIDEYLWRGMIVPDKEINIMSCVAKLLENIKV